MEESHSANTSCSVLNVAVSVFAETAALDGAVKKRNLSTGEVRSCTGA